jgi:hypothetical protein
LRFSTRTELARPFAEVMLGDNGYWSAIAAGSAPAGGGTLLAAVEGTLYDGPWVLDENLRKLNALVKWSGADVRIGLSGYTAAWTATDQVPERAIADGRIQRLGFIDPDLENSATRVALNLEGGRAAASWSAYAILSRLKLTSNFTYLLDNPEDGDQFIQRDRRVGLNFECDVRKRHAHRAAPPSRSRAVLACTAVQAVRVRLECHDDPEDRVACRRLNDRCTAFTRGRRTVQLDRVTEKRCGAVAFGDVAGDDVSRRVAPNRTETERTVYVRHVLLHECGPAGSRLLGSPIW